MLAPSMAPGSSPSLACRMHGIRTGQLSTWRKQFRSGELTGFVPVSVMADAGLPEPANAPVVADEAPIAAGPIEIALPTGVKLRVTGDVSEAIRNIRAILASFSWKRNSQPEDDDRTGTTQAVLIALPIRGLPSHTRCANCGVRAKV